MSLPSARIEEEGLVRSVVPPETPSRVTLALLGNVFQTIPRLFSSWKSTTFSLRSYVLCGFICARLRLALEGEMLGLPPLTILTNWKIAKIFEFLRSYRLGSNDSDLKKASHITGIIIGRDKLNIKYPQTRKEPFCLSSFDSFSNSLKYVFHLFGLKKIRNWRAKNKRAKMYTSDLSKSG